MTGFRQFARRLRRSSSGVAMVEFAMAMPFFLGVGMYGIETAHLAISNMRVAQLAAHLADNASRVGDTSMLENRRVYESDINDVFLGSNIQAGKLNFFKNGRAIISSLEVNDDGKQYIHWQRCKGRKDFDSAYGVEGDELDGMGPPGEEVFADDNDAVIFVELSYDYQPLISDVFTTVTEIRSNASFNVRDKRDLTQLYQRDEAAPDAVSSCDIKDDYDIIVG